MHQSIFGEPTPPDIPPPNPVNPRAWHEHSWMANSQARGHLRAAMPLTADIETKKIKKANASSTYSQHCSTFHWSYSQVVDLMSVLFWLTSAFDSAILIRTSWTIYHFMILIYVLLRYLFQTVKYYEKVNIIDRSMIVKLEISSPLNYSRILDQQKFRSITKKLSVQDNSSWLLAWLYSGEMRA